MVWPRYTRCGELMPLSHQPMPYVRTGNNGNVTIRCADRCLRIAAALSGLDWLEKSID
jgi:hypothetical protein